MTILCPTDFSATALTACKLALRIATKQEYRVHLLHAYAPFRSAFQGDLVNAADQERALQEAQKAMDAFIQALGLDAESTALTTSLSENDLIDAIDHYTAHTSTALIVMGTEGAKGAAGFLAGSNAYHIAKESDVPLLIVPENAVLPESGRSVFFTDYQAGDEIVLSTLRQIFGDEAAVGCTLVHITSDEHPDNITTEEAKLLEWKQRLEEAVAIKGLRTKIVSDEEHIDTVNDVLEISEADLALLTVVDGRNFFERLTKKSLAKAVILNPTTPILLVKQNK